MRAKLTLRDRLTRSGFPVNGSLDPRENAPLWAVGVVTAVLAATADLPDWARVVLVVACLGVGVAAQFLTVPAKALHDSGGPPVRDAESGALRQRDE